MAPDRLTLLLLTSLTGLGLSASPSRSVALPPLRETSPMVELRSPDIAPTPPDALLLAQDDSEPAEEKSPSRFPKALFLLAIGGIIVTAGAVFILMRLLTPPDLEEDEAEAEETEEVAPDEPLISLAQDPQTPISPEPRVPVAPPPAANPFPSEPEEEPETAPLLQIPAEEPPPEAERNGTRDVRAPAPEPEELKPPIAPPPSSPPAASVPAPEPPPPPQALPDRVERLILQLQYPDPANRSKAIWDLAQQGDSRAIEPLVNLLFTSDSKQRSMILGTLAEIGTRMLKPMSRALIFSLQDENPEVRQNAIRDLTRIYDQMYQTSQILQRAIDDPEPEVRETARWAADKLSRMRPLPMPTNDPPQR